MTSDGNGTGAGHERNILMMMGVEVHLSIFLCRCDGLSYHGDICTGYPTRKRQVIDTLRRGCSRQSITYPRDRTNPAVCAAGRSTAHDGGVTMLKSDSISIAEYSQLDRDRCAAYTTTLIALHYAYERGRITHIRKKELERQLRTDFGRVFRPERIRGFIAWCKTLREELEGAS